MYYRERTYMTDERNFAPCPPANGHMHHLYPTEPYNLPNATLTPYELPLMPCSKGLDNPPSTIFFRHFFVFAAYSILHAAIDNTLIALHCVLHTCHSLPAQSMFNSVDLILCISVFFMSSSNFPSFSLSRSIHASHRNCISKGTAYPRL